MVRNLTLQDETYEELKDRRRGDELAADVVRRLLAATEETRASTAGGGAAIEQNSASSTGGDGGTGQIEVVDSGRVEQLAPSDTDQLAKRAMTVDEVKVATVEQLSAGAYLKREYGVDPEEYNSESALTNAVREQRNSTEQGTPVTAGATGGDRGSDVGATGRDVDDGVDDPEAEQLAGKVLNLDDLQRINREGLSKREYLAEYRGVDPAEYRTEKALRKALTRASQGDA